MLQLHVIAHQPSAEHSAAPLRAPPLDRLSARSLASPAPGRTKNTSGAGEGWEDPGWYLANPRLVVFASVASDDAPGPAHRKRPRMGGITVSSLYHVGGATSPEDPGGVFLFPSLSVQDEGRHRLEFRLFEVIGRTLYHCKTVCSPYFYVDSAPDMASAAAGPAATRGTRAGRNRARTHRRCEGGESSDDASLLAQHTGKRPRSAATASRHAAPRERGTLSARGGTPMLPPHYSGPRLALAPQYSTPSPQLSDYLFYTRPPPSDHRGVDGSSAVWPARAGSDFGPPDGDHDSPTHIGRPQPASPFGPRAGPDRTPDWAHTMDLTTRYPK